MTSQFDTKDNFYLSDKDIQQLLSKLDEVNKHIFKIIIMKKTRRATTVNWHVIGNEIKGTETAINLRSLLCYKTAQLNELVSQLQLIDQVLFNVEHGTEQIELVLKDVISAGQEKLLHAQATLDSAIKSADTLYSVQLSLSLSFFLLCNLPFLSLLEETSSDGQQGPEEGHGAQGE